MRTTTDTIRLRKIDCHGVIRQWADIRLLRKGGFICCFAAATFLAAALPAPAEPMPAIGRLNHAGFRTVVHCTATLIAPDLVVSAAHCLPGPDTRDNVHFLPGFSPSGWREDLQPAGWAADKSGRDVAILCLAAPGRTVPLARSATGPVAGENVTVVGYGIPNKYRQTTTPCEVDRVDGKGAFTLSCPVRPGTSGAPVLRQSAHGSEVVGIVSATNNKRSRAFDISQRRALPSCN